MPPALSYALIDRELDEFDLLELYERDEPEAATPKAASSPVDGTAVAVISVLLTVILLALFFVFAVILPYRRRRKERRKEPISAAIGSAFARTPLGRGLSVVKQTSAKILGKEPRLKDRREKGKNPPKFPPPLNLTPRDSRVSFDPSAYYYRADELGDYNAKPQDSMESAYYYRDDDEKSAKPGDGTSSPDHTRHGALSAPATVHRTITPPTPTTAESDWTDSVYSQSDGDPTSAQQREMVTVMSPPRRNSTISNRNSLAAAAPRRSVSFRSQPQNIPLPASAAVPSNPKSAPARRVSRTAYNVPQPMTAAPFTDNGHLHPVPTEQDPSIHLRRSSSSASQLSNDPRIVQLLRTRARASLTSQQAAEAAAANAGRQSPSLHQVDRTQRHDSIALRNEEYYYGESPRPLPPKTPKSALKSGGSKSAGLGVESDMDSPNSVIVLSPSPYRSRLFTNPPQFHSPPLSPNSLR